MVRAVLGHPATVQTEFVNPLSLTKRGRVRLAIKLTPRSRSQGIAGVKDGRILVKLAAPPVDGKANHALVSWLAKTLKVKKTQVLIASGEKSRQKLVEIDGIDIESAKERLGLSDELPPVKE